MNTQYQDNYSALYSHKKNYDKGRRQKAEKTLAILSDAIPNSLAKTIVLEVGCYKGEISRYLSPFVSLYKAVDIDQSAIFEAKKEVKQKNLKFSVENAENLPYEDDSFDIVICSHVYEHVPNPGRMMSEIYRVLRVKGICYFAAGNRMKLVEPHHRLPLLSWLPKRVAHKYLALFGRGEYYYEMLYTYFSLKKLVSKFSVIDYTYEIIKHPERYRANEMIRPNSIRQLIAKAVYAHFKPLFPTYIWILVKEHKKDSK